MPCADCPFRAGSPFVYDEDALAVLADGGVPSCHRLVGMHAIFEQTYPTNTRCRGHDAWENEVAGFRAPTPPPSGGDPR